MKWKEKGGHCGDISSMHYSIAATQTRQGVTLNSSEWGRRRSTTDDGESSSEGENRGNINHINVVTCFLKFLLSSWTHFFCVLCPLEYNISNEEGRVSTLNVEKSFEMFHLFQKKINMIRFDFFSPFMCVLRVFYFLNVRIRSHIFLNAHTHERLTR